MTTIDRTLSATAKVERAKQHVRDFEIGRIAFLKTHSYTSIAYDEPQTGDRVIRCRIKAHSPAPLMGIVGDAIHNFRSALDHLACAAVEANNQPITDNTAFPIFYDRKSFESRFPGPISGASQDVLDLVKSLKPYKRGNELLWALHRLDIIDKHRLLIAAAAHAPLVVAQIGGRTPHVGFPLNADGHHISCPVGAVEDGAELYRLKRADRPKLYQDPSFGFEIGFGDVLKGQAIAYFLHQLLKLIPGIVDQFAPLLA